MIKAIEEFLKEKPGYLKEGAKRLQTILSTRANILATKEECRQAVRNVKLFLIDEECPETHYHTTEEFKDHQQEVKITTTNEIPEGFEIKSKWQSASGEWLMSLKPKDETKEEVDLIQELIDTFQDIIQDETEPLDITKPLYHSNLSKDLKVWTSDKHIGASGSEDNEYSAEEFKRRMDVIYLSIKDMVSRQGSFETITIADLGDALDGMDGFTVSRHHRLKQNMNNIECLEAYFRVHKNFFDRLFKSGFAENYQIWIAGNSNHGGDFEYAAHMGLLAYINGVYPDVKTELFKGFMNTIEHNGIHYLLTHGKDKENRFKGLPLFPTPQAVEYLEGFLKRKDIPRQARIRLIKGDLHQYCIAPCKNIEVYKTVPSLFGTSDWVLDNFELTEAGCAYEVLDLVTEDITEGIIKFK